MTDNLADNKDITGELETKNAAEFFEDDERKSEDRLSPGEMLKFFHLRYNHLTGLRSITARHYLSLLGFVALIVAAFIRFDGVAHDDLVGLFEKNKVLVIVFLLLLAIVGLCNIVYDSMCRKVANGSCDAIAFIIEKYFHDKKEQAEKHIAAENAAEKKENAFACLFSEEVFFSSAVILVDSGLFAVVFFLALSCSLSQWLDLLCIIAVFAVMVTLMMFLRNFIFSKHYCSPWALPDSEDRRAK